MPESTSKPPADAVFRRSGRCASPRRTLSTAETRLTAVQSGHCGPVSSDVRHSGTHLHGFRVNSIRGSNLPLVADTGLRLSLAAVQKSGHSHLHTIQIGANCNVRQRLQHLHSADILQPLQGLSTTISFLCSSCTVLLITPLACTEKKSGVFPITTSCLRHRQTPLKKHE